MGPHSAAEAASSLRSLAITAPTAGDGCREEEHTVALKREAMANGYAAENGVHSNGLADAEAGSADIEDDSPPAYHVPIDHVRGYGIDARDSNTPDNWIERHPELIRLTGRHPFNSEPPLDRLVDHGFITPTPLHYVRNHGYVPRCGWATWQLRVGGLVANPTTFTMADIEAMPSRTLPVTLVCVGNRRKEQNRVKKSRGFNWGAAAVSTSVWKGVLLRDVLLCCGILPSSRGAHFVCFEGAETLPGQGGTGSTYGTSISRAKALDPTQDVILAYEQNGERLTPDHGYPLRIIIPGFIGGRMVKWLKHIEVTRTESQNYYHFYDNRVLPSFVDSERADAERWWYKPEYICNELSINSAASAPMHNEELLLSGGQEMASYLLKGYAYSGGGRKVTRVEVTLDDGATWRLSELEHPEQPTEHGKWWCWCFWSLRVDVADLLGAREIAVRAWDEATNTQPEHLIWNVLGMMNNCWFRIRVHPVRTSRGLALRFEHPTVAGPTPGGWMDKEASAGPPAAASKTSVPNSQPAQTLAGTEGTAKVAAAPAQAGKEGVATVRPSTEGVEGARASSGLRLIPLSEVEKHDSAESAWVVVDGKVYDCTPFLKDHPGGADSILLNAGTDCTEEFDAIHSRKAKAMLADFLIGEVGEGGAESSAESADAPEAVPIAVKASAMQESPTALDPKKRLPFRLIRKDILSRDVRRFRFALPTDRHALGLPVGKHIFLSARINGSLVMRAYTPTSSDEDKGFFDVVVKVYLKGVSPQFPDGGLMSQHLEGLQIGDAVDVKGPLGHLHYRGRGVFTCEGAEHKVQRIAMIAGGTGITPMYQVIKAVLRDPQDATEMWLIYANRAEEDILLREELDAWASQHKDRFHVWYTVEAPPRKGWQYSAGRVCTEMFQEHLPPAGQSTVAFMCGPPGMIKFGCVPNLESLGYASNQLFTF